MKINKRIFNIICIMLLISMSAIHAQTKKEKKILQQQELKEVVNSKSYEVAVRMAHPQNGRNIPLTSSYTLKIKNDSVFSQLPYYGRAYSIPYGGGKGLMFESTTNNYEVKYSSKGVATIKFATRTDEDTYNFYIHIYPGGSSTIKVNMVNRQAITFHGELNKK